MKTVTTQYTCDVCGLKASSINDDLPGGWRYLHVTNLGYTKRDAIKSKLRDTNNFEVCDTCVGDFRNLSKRGNVLKRMLRKMVGA